MNTFRWMIRLGKKYWIFILGVASLVWFIIRVVPRPSRASYPCQRAAFPLASSFVIWLTGSLFTFRTFRTARNYLRSNRLAMAMGMLVISMAFFTFSYFIFPSGDIQASGLFQKDEIPTLRLAYNAETDQFIDPRATVSIVKSDTEDVLSITREQVETMVREAVELAGGLDDLISDGNTVVLKPNIVVSTFMGQEISTEANGMVTDWRVVAAVAKIVRELNPSGIILVMEGSADNSTLLAYERLNYTIEKIPEIDEFLALEDISGDWHDYDSEDLASVLIPAGRVLYEGYKLANGAAPYYYNKRYHDADVIISMPVLKNHETAGITGAVKNLGIGGTPTNIYGNGPNENGRWEVISHQVSDLQKFIHDFYFGCPAHFAVMDGIQGYSNGPNYNYGPNQIEGHQEQMGVILASKDPVAMDAIESLLMFDDPKRIPYLVYLDNSYIGCADPLAIDVRGASVSEVKKVFPHESKQINCDYSDAEPPGAAVENLWIANDTLYLSMTQASDISRVDIHMDGQSYGSFVIGQFEDIRIDLKEFTLTDTLLTIYAHDQYMNTDVFNYQEIREGTVGTANYTTEPYLSVYPNPVRDKLAVRFSSEYKGDVSISLYNQSGQLMMVEVVDKVTENFMDEMDLAGMETGSYHLVITAGSERYSSQVIKE